MSSEERSREIEEEDNLNDKRPPSIYNKPVARPVLQGCQNCPGGITWYIF